jgi:hypothetical protein
MCGLCGSSGVHDCLLWHYDFGRSFVLPGSLRTGAAPRGHPPRVGSVTLRRQSFVRIDRDGLHTPFASTCLACPPFASDRQDTYCLDLGGTCPFQRVLCCPAGGMATMLHSVDNLDNLLTRAPILLASSTLLKVVVFASLSFTSPFTVFSGLRPTQ